MADEPPFARSGASRKGKVIRAPRIVLATDESEALRGRLVAELADLKSADEAADWVQKSLPAKNTLTSADATLVEAAFERGLPRLGEDNQAHGYRRLSATQVPNTRRTKAKPSRSGTDSRPKPPRCGKDHSFARQGALQIRRHATVRRLRPHALRNAPHSLCSTACAQSQGQRRVRGPGLPPSSSRPAPLWR